MGLGNTFTGDNASTSNNAQQIQPQQQKGNSGSGMIGGIISGIGDLILGDRNASRQWKREKEAAEIQLKNQKDLNQYNQDLQFEMWKKTNYSEQIRQMEQAGLSPGLIYGMSGGGGTTTGSTGGNASTPNAPTQQAIPTSMAIQTGMQMELLQAQKENIQADTAVKIADAKSKGADVPLKTSQEEEIRAKIPTYAKGIEKTDAEIEKIASDIGVNQQTLKNLIATENKTKSETNRIDTLTPLEAKLTKIQTTGQEIHNKLTYAQIGKTYQETAAIANEIKQKWETLKQNAEQIRINWKNQNTNEQNMEINRFKNNIEKFKAEIQANYPNVMNVMGKTIDDGIKALYDTLGADEVHQRKIK